MNNEAVTFPEGFIAYRAKNAGTAGAGGHPTCTLSRSGLMIFNPTATKLLVSSRGGERSVVMAYNRKSGRVAIRACPKLPGLKPSMLSTSETMRGSSVTRFSQQAALWGIDMRKTRRCPCFFENDTLFVETRAK